MYPGYKQHKKHHKKHGSSSSSSSSSSSDDEPWKKEQKRQKKLMKKMKKHGGVMPPGAGYPMGAVPPPGGVQHGYAPPPGSYPAQPGAPGYPPQQGYPQQGGYPAPGGYPQAQPGQAPPFVPPQGQPQGYPPGQYPAAGGYPAGAPQYPAGQQPYPGGQQPYPGQQQPYPGAPGYPTPSEGAAYDQSGAPGYPAAAGYPSQPGGPPGYPSQPGGPADYPSQSGGPAGYPSQPGGQAPPPGAPAPAPADYQPTQPAPAQPQHAPHDGQPLGGEGGVDSMLGDLQRMKMGFQDGTAERFHGTISPASPFNVERDTEILRKAMKGVGTDEKAIINVVANRSNEQRQQIKAMFKTMYGKDLIKDLRSELSGDLEELILALFMPTTFYDAWSLHKAMQGAGTRENILIEILCTRTNAQIQEIIASYRKQYSQDLEKEISSETSGHFKRLLVSCLQGNRAELSPAQLSQVSTHGPQSVVDPAQAAADAQALYKAGVGKVGTDESQFLRVFATRSFYQLRAVFKEYEKIAGHNIVKAIEKEMSGDLERGFKAVAKSVLNRPDYFANKLRKAMKGAGTNESTLIRVIVSRSEIDLANIKETYQSLFGKPLAQAVKSETRGDFEKLLLALVK